MGLDRVERLEGEMAAAGIQIDYQRYGKVDGLLVLKDGASPYIAVAPDLPRRKLVCVLGHEIGHLLSGVTGQHGKDENRANLWSAIRLIRPAAIANALSKGVRNLAELADDLALDEEFLSKGLDILGKRYLYKEAGDFVISFAPLMAYNWRTGQYWPDENN